MRRYSFVILHHKHRNLENEAVQGDREPGSLSIHASCLCHPLWQRRSGSTTLWPASAAGAKDLPAQFRSISPQANKILKSVDANAISS
jgi:hypothetical protein